MQDHAGDAAHGNPARQQMALEDRILLPQRKWLRLTMANDPGAAIFEDHVPVAIAEIG